MMNGSKTFNKVNVFFVFFSRHVLIHILFVAVEIVDRGLELNGFDHFPCP